MSLTPTCSVVPNSHSNLDTGEDDFVVDQPLVKKKRLELSQCRGKLCGLLIRSRSRPRDSDCLHSQMFVNLSVDVWKPRSNCVITGQKRSASIVAQRQHKYPRTSFTNSFS